jgi:hypothetical protein
MRQADQIADDQTTLRAAPRRQVVNCAPVPRVSAPPAWLVPDVMIDEEEAGQAVLPPQREFVLSAGAEGSP